MSKCTFKNFGPSGTIQTKDALCVLPINILNEKIFYFMMIWLPFLAAVSAGTMLYRLATLLSSTFRSWVFRICHPTIRESTTSKEGSTIDIILSRGGIGDWFLLQLIGTNVNHHVFQVFDIAVHQRTVHNALILNIFPPLCRMFWNRWQSASKNARKAMGFHRVHLSKGSLLFRVLFYI